MRGSVSNRTYGRATPIASGALPISQPRVTWVFLPKPGSLSRCSSARFRYLFLMAFGDSKKPTTRTLVVGGTGGGLVGGQRAARPGRDSSTFCAPRARDRPIRPERARTRAALERKARVGNRRRSSPPRHCPTSFRSSIARAWTPTATPLSYVDRTALRSLLARGQYQALSKYIEQFEADAEADFHNEYRIHDAIDALDDTRASVGREPRRMARGHARFACTLGGARRASLCPRLCTARRRVCRENRRRQSSRAWRPPLRSRSRISEHALRLNLRLMPARREEIRIAGRFACSTHRWTCFRTTQSSIAVTSCYDQRLLCGTPEELTALESAANAAPHDFYAHQRLDYALSQSAQWDRIVTMWSSFMLANPSEGRAYYSDVPAPTLTLGQNARPHRPTPYAPA